MDYEEWITSSPRRSAVISVEEMLLSEIHQLKEALVGLLDEGTLPSPNVLDMLDGWDGVKRD